MQRAMVREREVEFHQALNKRRDREVFMVSNFGQSVNYRKCFKPSPLPGSGGEWPGGGAEDCLGHVHHAVPRLHTLGRQEAVCPTN